MAQAPRHHGFTCPNCGSHFFGTYRHHRTMGDKYPHDTSVGNCQEYLHAKSACRFQWNRDDAVAEAECMYTQTPEEWAQSHAAFVEDMRQRLATPAA